MLHAQFAVPCDGSSSKLSQCPFSSASLLSLLHHGIALWLSGPDSHTLACFLRLRSSLTHRVTCCHHTQLLAFCQSPTSWSLANLLCHHLSLCWQLLTWARDLILKPGLPGDLTAYTPRGDLSQPHRMVGVEGPPRTDGKTGVQPFMEHLVCVRHQDWVWMCPGDSATKDKRKLLSWVFQTWGEGDH